MVQCSALHRFFPSMCAARICCQGTSAQFRKGELHLVTDLDGVAGAALLDAVSGRTTYVSGEVWIDGFAAEQRDRRQRIATIGMALLLIPQLSVEDHLWCMVHLHKKERRAWKREMVLAAANFTNLDVRRRIDDLTEMEKFRLQVALELVLDPPAMFFLYALDAMDLEQQTEATELLCRLTREIKKTVVLCTRSLPVHLFSAAYSLLLLGAGGVMLYSGLARDAISFFNSLRIPSNIPDPLWTGLVTPVEEASESENDGETSSMAASRRAVSSVSSSAPDGRTRSQSRLYSALCTPPRLSSRLVSAHLHRNFARLLSTTGPEAPSAGEAVVEVATSGDLVDLATEWAESETQTMYYAAKYYDSAVHTALLASLGTAASHPLSSGSALATPLPRTAPNSVWKFCILLTYTLRQITADAELLVGVAFLSVGLTALAVLAHSQPESQGGMFNIRGLIFMGFTLVLFTNLVTMDRAVDQLRIAVLHCKRHLYGVAGFTACLAFRIALIRSVYLALFIPFVLFVLKSSYAFALLAWCVGCTHAAFHYVAAALLPSRWWTVRVWYAAFGCNIIFSGFLLNLNSVPSFLGDLSFLRWGYGAVLHTWLHGVAFQCDGANNTWYCYTGDEYLDAQGMSGDSVTTASVVLSLYAMGLMTFLGLVLHAKSR